MHNFLTWHPRLGVSFLQSLAQLVESVLSLVGKPACIIGVFLGDSDESQEFALRIPNIETLKPKESWTRNP